MSGQLSPEQLRQGFTEQVQPYLEMNRGGDTSVSPPRFISVGGQPGAGKSGALRQAKRDNPGAVIVNGDELRQFHPAYPQVMATDPLSMPEVTAQAAGQWVGMSNQWLREQQISAVVETTLRQPAVLLREFEAFHDAGYVTELRVVAVPVEVSRLGTLTRYIEQIQDFGAGRAVTTQGHDVPATAVPSTVEALVASGLVDRLVIQDRDGRAFLDLDVSQDGPELAAQAREMVDQTRDVASMTPQQAQNWFQIATNTLTALKDAPLDQDLLQVSAQLATRDAKAIAARAWPTEPEMQRHQVDVLQHHHWAAVRAATLTRSSSRTTGLRPRHRSTPSRPDHGHGGPER